MPKAPSKPKKVGRPTIYTDKLADEICAKIADGQSLRTVCSPDEMPNITTIYEWIRSNDQFSKQYARAKDDAADAMVEDMLNIADTEIDVQKARLMVDTRKWIASKLKAKKYGDKITQEHSGPDGGAIKTETSFDLSDLDPDERAAVRAIIAKRAADKG